MSERLRIVGCLYSLRPILRTKYVIEMGFSGKSTYSMKAWIKMSGRTLNAADHIRWTRLICAFC